VIGGWPRDSERDVVEGDMKAMLNGIAGVKEFHAIGRFTSLGKVRFGTSNEMWDWIRTIKENPLKSPLPEHATCGFWASVEKSRDEIATGKATKAALQALVSLLVESGVIEAEAKARTNADFSQGTVWLRPAVGASKIRILERTGHDFVIAATAATSGLADVQARAVLDAAVDSTL